MTDQQSAQRPDEDVLDESPFRSSLRTVLLVDLALLSVWAAWSHPGVDGVGRLLLVGVWSLPALWTLTTNPVLRKLAIRRMRRRPQESWFIVICVAVITTLLTLTTSLSDSIVRSSRTAVDTTFGSVDELLEAPSPADRLEAQSRLNEALAAKSDTVNDLSLLVRGQLGLVSADMVFRAGGHGSNGAPSDGTTVPPLLERSVHVMELNVDAARRFGIDPLATGLAGRTNLAPGRVFLGPYAAEALRAEAGSTVSMIGSGGEEQQLRVEAVLPRRGFGVLPLDGADFSRVAIVPVGTLTTMISPPPLRYVIAISNRDGSKSTDAVVEHLERTFSGVAAVDAPDGQARPTVNVFIDNVKTQILAKASARTQPLGRLLRTTVWLLGLGAGVLLLALFFSLAAIRNAEIGALRSVGLRRRDAVSAFGLEGWMYAIVGSLAGTGGGAVAATLVLRRSFGTVGVATASSVPKPESLLIGMASGFVLTCVAIALSLFVTTQGTVHGTVRNLQRSADLSERLARTLSTLGAAALIGLFLCWRSTHDRGSFAFLLGLLMLVTAASFAWRELALSRRTVPTVLSRPRRIAIVAAGLIALTVLPSTSSLWFRHTGTGTWVSYALCFVVLGTALQAVLPPHLNISANKKSSEGARRAAKTLANAQPGFGARRDRLIRAATTSLVMALTVVGFLYAGLVSEASTRARASKGGWDYVAQTAEPTDSSRLVRSLGSSAVAAPVTSFNFEVRGNDGRNVRVDGLGVTRAYLSRQPTVLSKRSKGIASASDAFNRLISESGTAIVDQNLFVDGSTRLQRVAVGETLFLLDLRTGRTLTVTVIGLARSTGTLGGVVVGPSTAGALRGAEPIADGVLISPADPKSPNDRAAVHKALMGPDVTYRSIDNPLDERNLDGLLVRRSLRWLSLLGGMLVVGVVSVLFLHSFAERRKDWAVLRSLGMSAPAIRRLAVSESLHMLVPAVTVGWLAGVIVAWRLVWAGSLGIGAGYPFSILSVFGSLSVVVVPTVLVNRYLRRSLANDAPMRRKSS